MYRPLFVEVDVEGIKRSETPPMPAGFLQHFERRLQTMFISPLGSGVENIESQTVTFTHPDGTKKRVTIEALEAGVHGPFRRITL